MAYIGTSPQNGVRNRFVYAATQGQTAFTGADADSKTLVVSDQLYTDVYQNGVKLKLTTDWTASSTTVTLVNAASVDDVIEIVSFDVFSVSDTVPASTGGTFNGGIAATTGTFSGDVGIGTTSPDAKAHIYSGTGGKTLVLENPNNDYSGIEFRANSLVEGRIKVANDGMHFFSDTGTSSQTMLLNPSGNVGIGTTSPILGQLHVLASGTSDASMENVAHFGKNSTSRAGLQITANATLVDVGMQAQAGAGNLDLSFSSLAGGSRNERMRINSSGSVLVGTTSNIAANAKIFAKGSGVGIALGYGTGSAEYRHLYMNSGDGAMYVFNNTNYANLSASGAWTNASDRRIKKNIVDIKYGLEDVLKIQPRSYQMKEVSGDYIGLIAQEVEEIIPEVVSGDPEKQLTLDYGSLVAVAFKAIQEQQTVIESLKTRITALEAE